MSARTRRGVAQLSAPSFLFMRVFDCGRIEENTSQKKKAYEGLCVGMYYMYAPIQPNTRITDLACSTRWPGPFRTRGCELLHPKRPVMKQRQV